MNWKSSLSFIKLQDFRGLNFCDSVTAMILVMSATVIDVPTRDLLAVQPKGSFV